MAPAKGKAFAGVLRDLADREESVARLNASARMATIGALAAGLGHDMNNVLLPVRAHLNVLRAEANAGGCADIDRIERIRNAIDYLQQLADSLHGLIAESDGSPYETINLAEWWRQVGALLSEAVARHVRVTASLPADLPEVAMPAHALTQAALNLIVNAGEAVPRRANREGRVHVSAVALLNRSRLRLSVSDNGAGMSKEVRRRACDVFFSTKPRGVGTGLGLAMVRGIVERAGGSIEIESRLGKGTTVSLVLPTVTQRYVDQTPLAAVTIGDGRAAALIQSFLHASGLRSNLVSDPAHADIWFTEPSALNLQLARVWRSAHPDGRLVLFGQPKGAGAAAWNDLYPLASIVPSSLDSIRCSIERAMDGW